MIRDFEKGDVVVTRANNLAVIGEVNGPYCNLKILKKGGNCLAKEGQVGEYEFSGVSITTLERTGIHVVETEFVRDDDGRRIVRYRPIFRFHLSWMASGQLEFAAYEEMADAPQSVKDAQMLAAIENACKVMDDITHHWQLVRV